MECRSSGSRAGACRIGRHDPYSTVKAWSPAAVLQCAGTQNRTLYIRPLSRKVLLASGLHVNLGQIREKYELILRHGVSAHGEVPSKDSVYYTIYLLYLIASICTSLTRRIGIVSLYSTW